MPEGALYVGRPTKWGNPFTPDNYRFCTSAGERPATIAECVALYRAHLTCDDPRCLDVHGDGSGVMEHSWTAGLDVTELRGKDLACWCPLEDEHGNRVPCHADVLVELANAEATA